MTSRVEARRKRTNAAAAVRGRRTGAGCKGKPESGSGIAQHLRFYRDMLRIRMVEEAIANHYAEGEMRCPVHLSIGQEAAAVGTCAALEPTDKIYSTHRSHAHYLAKGGALDRMLAEIYGKAAGCVGGRGGSMHLMDLAQGMVASIPIVSSSIPLAVGSALAAKRSSAETVTLSFLGDAAVEEGVFHESANFAALHKLPVVFICENNLYSVYTPLRQRQPSRPITRLAEAHDVPANRGDGNDVIAVYRLAKAAVRRARSGRGPSFLLLDTYRSLEHCGPKVDNDLGYRTPAEARRWRNRDPLPALARVLPMPHAALVRVMATMKAEIAAEIEAAFDFARSTSLPAPERVGDHVYSAAG